MVIPVHVDGGGAQPRTSGGGKFRQASAHAVPDSLTREGAESIRDVERDNDTGKIIVRQRGNALVDKFTPSFPPHAILEGTNRLGETTLEGGPSCFRRQAPHHAPESQRPDAASGLLERHQPRPEIRAQGLSLAVAEQEVDDILGPSLQRLIVMGEGPPMLEPRPIRARA